VQKNFIFKTQKRALDVNIKKGDETYKINVYRKQIFGKQNHLENKMGVRWIGYYSDTGLCSLSGFYISTFIIGSKLSCTFAANEPLLRSLTLFPKQASLLHQGLVQCGSFYVDKYCYIKHPIIPDIARVPSVCLKHLAVCFVHFLVS